MAALSFDLGFGLIKKHLLRGSVPVLKKNLERLSSLIEKPGFRDSFKGVFMERDYRIDPAEIKRLAGLKERC